MGTWVFGIRAFSTRVFGTWAAGVALTFLIMGMVAPPLHAKSDKRLSDEELKIFLEDPQKAVEEIKPSEEIGPQSIEQFLTTLQELYEKIEAKEFTYDDLVVFVQTWEAAFDQHGETLPPNRSASLRTSVQEMRRLLNSENFSDINLKELEKNFGQGHRISTLILQGGDLQEVGWYEHKLSKKENQLILSHQALNLLSKDFLDNNLGVGGKDFWKQRQKILQRLSALQGQLLKEQRKLNEDLIKLVRGSEQLKEFRAAKEAEYQTRAQNIANTKAKQQAIDRSIKNAKQGN